MTIDPHSTLPVTVVGGYLGSGKTTLINHWLRKANGVRLAILVNDFGDLPIDADLIESQDDNVINLSGGCVCCSYGNDLSVALVDMLAMPERPDQVVLEASGVALPGAIAASVGLINGYSIQGVMTLADADSILERASDKYMHDTILRQVTDADLIVMSKVDLVSDEVEQKVCDWLSDKAPNTPIMNVAPNQIPLEILASSVENAWQNHDHHHHNPFSSYSMAFDRPIEGALLSKLLTKPEYGILRAKGFFYDADGGMSVLQQVGRRCEVNRVSANKSPGLVFIGHKLVDQSILADEITGLQC